MSARHRVIGRALRDFRHRAGLQLEDAAAVLGCDKSKITRVEEGERGIRPAELGALLEAYDAGPVARDGLLPLARVHGAGGWWDAHPGALRPGELDLAVAESAALRIVVYAPLAVPALLQSEAYMRLAVAADPRVADGASNRVVAARLARAKAVLSRRTPLEVVLGAAALQFPVPDDVVRRDQARHAWPRPAPGVRRCGCGCCRSGRGPMPSAGPAGSRWWSCAASRSSRWCTPTGSLAGGGRSQQRRTWRPSSGCGKRR
jgi:transcriptional regulator with XRE-family HTH domain